MQKLIYGLLAFLIVIGYPTISYAQDGKEGENAFIVPKGIEEEIEPVAEELLFAKSAVLMDGSSGRVLYEKNGEEFLSNASTTKILTCILALENADENDLVKVSSYAASMPDVQLNIREGEQYLLGDLLYSLMLESHNDSAVAIAEHISGSCEEFSRLMNAKAVEIGCENTYFLTPNGLDATETVTGEDGSVQTKAHGTTATDLGLLMRYCIELSPMKDRFLEITGTPRHTFSNKLTNEDGTVVNGDRSFSSSNHNSFLQMMDGAISGKTGFTNKAGYCYVGALRREERTYIVALLACGWPSNRTYKWQDTRKLMDYGLKAYGFYSLDQLNPDWNSILSARVEQGQGDGIGEAVNLSLQREKKLDIEGLLLRSGEELALTVKKEPLVAPVKKGQKAGEIIYLLNGREWKKEVLVCERDVERIDYKWCVEKCLDLLCI